MKNQFHLVAGNPCLDFANSLDYRFDSTRTIDLIPTYDRLIDFTRQTELITEQQAHRLRLLKYSRHADSSFGNAIQLREILESIFRAVPAKKAPADHWIGRLNQFLEDARKHESICWKSGKLVRRFEELDRNTDAPIWLLSESAVALLASHELTMLRECHEKSCRWLFLDRSKNHSRRWCAMELCGNRAKIRKFRGRG